jgi:hypothetical protein
MVGATCKAHSSPMYKSKKTNFHTPRFNKTFGSVFSDGTKTINIRKYTSEWYKNCIFTKKTMRSNVKKKILITCQLCFVFWRTICMCSLPVRVVKMCGTCVNFDLLCKLPSVNEENVAAIIFNMLVQLCATDATRFSCILWTIQKQSPVFILWDHWLINSKHINTFCYLKQ